MLRSENQPSRTTRSNVLRLERKGHAQAYDAQGLKLLLLPVRGALDHPGSEASIGKLLAGHIRFERLGQCASLRRAHGKDLTLLWPT